MKSENGSFGVMAAGCRDGGLSLVILTVEPDGRAWCEEFPALLHLPRRVTGSARVLELREFAGEIVRLVDRYSVAVIGMEPIDGSKRVRQGTSLGHAFGVLSGIAEARRLAMVGIDWSMTLKARADEELARIAPCCEVHERETAARWCFEHMRTDVRAASVTDRGRAWWPTGVAYLAISMLGSDVVRARLAGAQGPGSANRAKPAAEQPR